MPKSSVRVVVRTRPTANFAHDSLRVKPDSNNVDIFVKKKESQGAVNNQRENYSFQFDAVLHNASQETVYDECARPIVSSVMDGYNGTILAYGQTGAGKTYTMTGGSGNYKVRGLVPRALQQIFQEVASRPDQAVTVRVSYHENYNESLIDLLDPLAEQSSDLVILEDTRTGVYIRGLTSRIANTEEEALNFLFEGETNRAIGEHQLNAASSRSHTVFTITVEARSRIESSERVTFSKLNLVDLAGSERVSKTGSSGVVLIEAMHINKSLSFLEQVVNALSDRHRDHVPFRQSKLTHYLKDSLGGNCRTIMIANIWGESAHLEETISTLNFATRMMRVKNDATVNVQMDAELLVRKYEREIKELKSELAMHDALSGRSRVTYEAYTEEQRHELHLRVQSYISGELEELEVVNLRQVREIFMQFRIVARNLQSDAAASAAGGAGRGERVSSLVDKKQQIGKETSGVGDVSGASGFSVGVVDGDARPITSQKVTSGKESSAAGRGLGGVSRARMSRPVTAVMPDKNVAFEEYKANEGLEISNELRANSATLKEKKKMQKDLAIEINAHKEAIDRVKNSLALKKGERGDEVVLSGGTEVIDEEEFSLIKDLKEAKKKYKESFENLRVLRSELDYLSKLVDQARTKLVMDFEDWYSSLAAGGSDEVDSGETDRAEGPTDAGGDGEVLDDGEIFDKMEMQRVMEDDPESLAYFNAKKNISIHSKKVPPSKGRVATRAR